MRLLNNNEAPVLVLPAAHLYCWNPPIRGWGCDSLGEHLPRMPVRGWRCVPLAGTLSLHWFQGFKSYMLHFILFFSYSVFILLCLIVRPIWVSVR